MTRDATAVSRYLSYLLRHHPEAGNLELDHAGWTDVTGVLAALHAAGHRLPEAGLIDLVETNDKRRFELGEGRIRAAQGHSVPVDLGLEPVRPPVVLYHGTVARFLDSIRREGLGSGTRRHVHLSTDVTTATAVGSRRGPPVVLTIDAAGMHDDDGATFFRSANGVWLTAAVPARRISMPNC